MKILVFAPFFFVFLLSCKKEQPALRSLEEDCSCAKEVSADFTINEIYSYGYEWEKRTETDTIYYNKNVSFFALEANAEYTWIIGSETLSQKEVVRYFDASQAGQTIPVKLIVKKKPNLICLPNDDGIDTLVKNLYVSDKKWNNVYDDPNYRFEGTFRMKEKNASDSIDITVYIVPSLEVGIDGLDSPDRIIFVNLFGTNTLEWASIHDGINYRQLWLELSASQSFFHYRLDNFWELNYINTLSGLKLNYTGRKL